MKRKRLFSAVLALALFTGTFATATQQKAEAYQLQNYRMETQIWYQPHAVFLQPTKEAFRSSMVTWNAHLPEYRRVCFDWTVHYVSRYPFHDGKNLITKEPMSDSSVVAQNYCWCNVSLRGNTIVESDINLNYNQQWINGSDSDRYDVQSVMLHEVGHTVGLDHSEYKSAAMYAYSYKGAIKRSLSQDDIDGLNARYQ